jgi:hypothetical protein
MLPRATSVLAFALALCAALVLAVPVAAADPPPGAVEWSVPPLPTNRPQTFVWPGVTLAVLVLLWGAYAWWTAPSRTLCR